MAKDLFDRARSTQRPDNADPPDNVIPLPVRRGSKIAAKPSRIQRLWLARGLDQPGGKLPLFDHQGGAISPRTIRSCIKNGWAEPWFSNPTKPDWLVCRLTPAGRAALRD